MRNGFRRISSWGSVQDLHDQVCRGSLHWLWWIAYLASVVSHLVKPLYMETCRACILGREDPTDFSQCEYFQQATCNSRISRSLASQLPFRVETNNLHCVGTWILLARTQGTAQPPRPQRLRGSGSRSQICLGHWGLPQPSLDPGAGWKCSA